MQSLFKSSKGGAPWGFARKRAIGLAIGVLLLFSLAVQKKASAQENLVYAIEVEGTIDAGISNFVRKAIDQAEAENVPLIIKLNTPGGLLKSTEEIVQNILNSRVKVVVWVTPKGAWGFSAGTFILVASDIAAMDNATSIGAAQPRPQDPKTTNAMAEWIASVARSKGRPENVVRRFVTESQTMGPEEALSAGVINLRASKMEEILENIRMAGARTVNLEMGIFEKALRALSNPEVASILFILGFFGLLFEITTPGIGVPGVAGAICILLSFYGMGVLQINYAGIALVLLGVVLLVTEIFTPGFGVFGVGGGFSLIIGLGMFGIYSEPWVGGISGDLVKAAAIALLVAFAIFLVLVRRSVRRPSPFGEAAIKGKTGTAATDISPKGLVKIKGELWTATSTKRIKKGELVVVKGVKGIILVVGKAKRKK
ncbi:MAG: nodulation protein NfeD [Candidatus Hadarchaeota archaeon]